VAASLGQLFRGAKLCEGFTAKDLWTHCIAVAVAAREMAKQMKAPIADEAFLAGMIHDIGILVSLQLWPEQLREVCDIARRDGRPFREVEQEKFGGVDHQMLGQALTEMWKFPRPCQLVAGYHHEPATLGDDNRLLVSLVYTADVICCQSKHGFNLTALNQALDGGGAGEAIDPAIAAKVAENLDALIGGANTLLG
jgi:HD-like signal output (HDOD) protein